ncbi:CehA/McbA family metallohydrolase domain-containing protein [Parafilimonas terrae]|uniref:Uncharacterized protein n=1 Tax=Parafilimonas terrae TaxID=1465490 RepID=A0A1I5WV24_9BACT|nr:hypothetical protein [Parafilimonas terrae]SFQ23468.1 hypothetical protein SAMN05444277_10716 [Parafilimonas terrae]
MKYLLPAILLCISVIGYSQDLVRTSQYNKKSKTSLFVTDSVISISWPTGHDDYGKMLLDLSKNKPLFKAISTGDKTSLKNIANNIDPAFILTVGKRDLVSQNGWNIFFDKVPLKPHESFVVNLHKDSAAVITEGTHTIVRIYNMQAASFSGFLEITVYNGSPLFNVAAVLATNVDSTAILYDAGLMSASNEWNKIAWNDTGDRLIQSAINANDTAKNIAVKYRTIAGENNSGSLAVFPAPHQYFYPLDEAFNLKFTWYGNNYRKLLKGFGMGIRQEPEGDKRFVPWFNAPPGTKQRLNFFCLISSHNAEQNINAVKKFTHDDRYVALPGYKTMSSHFHNEFIMNVVLKGKPVPEHPSFVNVFKNTGVDIVHLAEFHYTAHPKGPDSTRLNELHALFEQCKRLSDDGFLLLPGEEPNEFFGGHWLAFFPKPVYWIMSRNANTPYLSFDKQYGKIYHIGDTTDMFNLLKDENGLAWTAHPRTKGSVGYPDKYKNASFFTSDHFLGAAWKAMPADLSQPRLGKRVLDLMDDMNNWGLKKHVIGEADVFSIEPENEMYAHLNVNYLQLNTLPKFDESWQPILTAMQQGKFFTTTGEVLIPSFTVNGKATNEIARPDANGNAKINMHLNWTFPLQYVEIISGDGKNVYRDSVSLNNTTAFGDKDFTFNINLKNRKWVRAAVWDVAVNGAFTQTVWLEE